ncbi:MAG: DUF2147 domain-containing protein [Rubricoccaceae bacterium]
MKTLTLHRALGVLTLLLFAVPALAQTPVGVWRTIDDQTGEPKSLVRIFEESGNLVGDIQTLLPEGRLCEACVAPYQGTDVSGTRIMWGFSRDGDTWKGGRILNVANGKEYKAKMKLQPDGTLRLWGYVGLDTPLTRKAQVWERVR